MHSKRAPRRRHGAELKDKVLAACDEPGASVAAVALAHDLNANLVHKWRRGRDARPLSSPAGMTASEFVALPLPSAPPAVMPAAPAPAPAPAPALVATGMVDVTTQQPGAPRTLTDAGAVFVPVQLEMPRAAPADIRLELHRGAATVVVTWPAQEAAACGSWLREWLR